MKAQVTKVDKKPSRYGGNVFVVYLKTWESGSYKCWVDPKNRNFARWREIIQRGAGTILDDLVVINEKKKLVDADSLVKIVRDNFKTQESNFGNSNIPSGFNSDGERE